MNRHPFKKWSRRAAGTGCSVALVVGMATAAAATPSGLAVLSNSWGKAEKASSVTISGSGVDSSSGATYTLSATVNSKGDARGWVSLQGNRVDFVKVGSEDYFKAGAAFWKANGGTGGSAAATIFAGKWLKASGQASPLSGFATLFGFRGFFKSNPPSQLHGVTVKHVTFHGHSAYQVRGTQNGQTGTVIVSASSPGYPIEISAPGGTTITFSNWNHHLTVHAPHGAIDFNSLAG